MRVDFGGWYGIDIFDYFVESGVDAQNIESHMVKTFKQLPLDVLGFKRENTSMCNAVAFENYIDSLGLKREFQ